METNIIKTEEQNKLALATSLAIANTTDLEQATTLLSELNLINDRITKEKERITKPLNEALKAERSRWKPAEEVLSTAISSIRSKMSLYQTAQLKAQQLAEQAIAKRVAPGKGNFTPETAINKLSALEKTPDKITTDNGSIKFRTVKRFEIMDITLVPSQYLLPNETAIRKAMVDGIEVAGVRYFEEQLPINRRN